MSILNDIEYERKQVAAYWNINVETMMIWDKRYDFYPRREYKKFYYLKSTLEKFMGASIEDINTPLLCRKDAGKYINYAPMSLAQFDSNETYNLKPIKLGYVIRYQKSVLDDFKRQQFR